MATMNISLPEAMKSFIEGQATKEGFGTVSEYMRAVIREVQERERDRQAIRGKLLEAVQGGPASPMTEADWADVRREVHRRHAERQGEAHESQESRGR